MTENLIIRADADSQIGIGHVIRCLALSQAWQDQCGRSVFIAARMSPTIQAMFEAEGSRVHLIDVHPGSHADAAATTEMVRKFKASWVALDGYHFDTNYQKTLKDSSNRLLCIDDNSHARFYSADIVLNQNAYADERLYANKEAYTQLLVGPWFSLLRRQFRNRNFAIRNTSRFARRLLVTMGGGDPNNVTLRVVKALKRVTPADFAVKIVVGQTNPHLDSLVHVIGDKDGTYTLLNDVHDMADLMAWAEMAVSGGGSTCWEMACMGLPALVLTTVDNQQSNARCLGRLGVVKALGWHKDCGEAKIAEAIEQLALSSRQRREMAKKAAQMVDGKGAIRVVQHMCEM